MKPQSSARFQFAVLGDAAIKLGDLSDTDAIEWLLCKSLGEHLFEFHNGDAIVASINLDKPRFDLHNLVGIIVIGDANELDSVQSKWHSKVPSLNIAFRGIPEFDVMAILRSAIECMSDELTLQRLHSGRAALELATYRREFERLQCSFTRLEHHVAGQSIHRLIEIFENPPDSLSVTRESSREKRNEGEPDPGSVNQYAPVDSFGFASFSLYILGKPVVSAEPLVICLKAIETADLYGKWHINAAEVNIGWVELALDKAIDELALTLVISVEWPVHTNGWSLALGPPNPYAEFSAYTEGSQHLAAPLALRIFSGLPGTHVQPTTSAIRPVDAPSAPIRLVPYEAYSRVAQVFPRVNGSNPSLVSYDPVIGSVTVHPRKGGLITAARMSVVSPTDAWRISAQVHLAHEQASPTQFGFMACPGSNVLQDDEDFDHLDTSAGNFSGWKTLSPLEKKNISVFVVPQHEEQLSVYLLTRQDANLSQDFAWARFAKLEFHILPASVSKENQSPELISLLRLSVPQ